MIHQSARLLHSELPLLAASDVNNVLSVSLQRVTRQNTRAFAQVLSKLAIEPSLAAVKVPEVSSQPIAAGQVSVAAASHREVATGFAALIPPTTNASAATAPAAPVEVLGNTQNGVIRHWYPRDPGDHACWAKQPA